MPRPRKDGETPANRAPAMADELWAFNEMRRRLLRGRPIDPEGVPELMPMPPGADEEMNRP